MPSILNVEALELKFSSLTRSRDSITGVSAWILRHSDLYEEIVEEWLAGLYKDFNTLNMLYVANDVIMNCSKKKAPQYRPAFRNVLPTVMGLQKVKEVSDKVLRMVNMWNGRGIFSDEFCKALIEKVTNPEVEEEPIQESLEMTPKNDVEEEESEMDIIANYKKEHLFERLSVLQTVEEEVREKEEIIKYAEEPEGRNFSSLGHREAQELKNKMERYCEVIKRFIRLGEEEIQIRKNVIIELKNSNIFYTSQNEDVKKVAHAYKVYGKKIKRVLKDLSEKRETLPVGISSSPDLSDHDTSSPKSPNDAFSHDYISSEESPNNTSPSPIHEKVNNGLAIDSSFFTRFPMNLSERKSISNDSIEKSVTDYSENSSKQNKKISPEFESHNNMSHEDTDENNYSEHSLTQEDLKMSKTKENVDSFTSNTHALNSPIKTSFECNEDINILQKVCKKDLKKSAQSAEVKNITSDVAADSFSLKNNKGKAYLTPSTHTTKSLIKSNFECNKDLNIAQKFNNKDLKKSVQTAEVKTNSLMSDISKDSLSLKIKNKENVISMTPSPHSTKSPIKSKFEYNKDMTTPQKEPAQNASISVSAMNSKPNRSSQNVDLILTLENQEKLNTMDSKYLEEVDQLLEKSLKRESIKRKIELLLKTKGKKQCQNMEQQDNLKNVSAEIENQNILSDNNKTLVLEMDKKYESVLSDKKKANIDSSILSEKEIVNISSPMLSDKKTGGNDLSVLSDKKIMDIDSPGHSSHISIKHTAESVKNISEHNLNLNLKNELNTTQIANQDIVNDSNSNKNLKIPTDTFLSISTSLLKNILEKSVMPGLIHDFQKDVKPPLLCTAPEVKPFIPVSDTFFSEICDTGNTSKRSGIPGLEDSTKNKNEIDNESDLVKGKQSLNVDENSIENSANFKVHSNKPKIVEEGTLETEFIKSKTKIKVISSITDVIHEETNNTTTLSSDIKNLQDSVAKKNDCITTLNSINGITSASSNVSDSCSGKSYRNEVTETVINDQLEKGNKPTNIIQDLERVLRFFCKFKSLHIHQETTVKKMNSLPCVSLENCLKVYNALQHKNTKITTTSNTHTSLLCNKIKDENVHFKKSEILNTTADSCTTTNVLQQPILSTFDSNVLHHSVSGRQNSVALTDETNKDNLEVADMDCDSE